MPTISNDDNFYTLPTIFHNTEQEFPVKKPGQVFDPWPDPTRTQIADPVTRWPVTRRPGSISGWEAWGPDPLPPKSGPARKAIQSN